MTKTNFLGDEIPKENVHYTCVTCITIYFVAKIEKKYPQVYLEECKYKDKENKDAWIYRRCIGIRISSGSK